ncbi:MAG: hypothetical protein OEV42_05110 [Deltaproteobacteria bacterium]|nr:hypothetical protein [Deltaproteobacteria bacterium]
MGQAVLNAAARGCIAYESPEAATSSVPQLTAQHRLIAGFRYYLKKNVLTFPTRFSLKTTIILQGHKNIFGTFIASIFLLMC